MAQTRSGSGTKKKTTAKQPKQKPIRREVGAGVCLLLALLACIGYSDSAQDYWLIKWLCVYVFKGLLGWGFYIVPPCLLWAAGILAFHRGRPVKGRLIALGFVPLLFGALIHLFNCTLDIGFDWPSIRSLYVGGWNGETGGVLAGLLAVIFTKAIGKVGSTIVFIIALFAVVCIAGKLPVRQTVENIKNRPRPEYEPMPDPVPEKTVAKKPSRRAEKANEPIPEIFSLPGRPNAAAPTPTQTAAPASTPAAEPQSAPAEERTGLFRKRRKAAIDIPMEDENESEPVSDIPDYPTGVLYDNRPTREAVEEVVRRARAQRNGSSEEEPFIENASPSGETAPVDTKADAEEPFIENAGSGTGPAAADEDDPFIDNTPIIPAQPTPAAEIPAEPQPEPQGEPEEEPLVEEDRRSFASVPAHDIVPDTASDDDEPYDDSYLAEYDENYDPDAEEDAVPASASVDIPVDDAHEENAVDENGEEYTEFTFDDEDDPAPRESVPFVKPAALPYEEEPEEDEDIPDEPDEPEETYEEEPGAEYEFPPVTLLRAASGVTADAGEEVAANRQRLETTLHSFNIGASVTDITRGPTVTRYDLELEAGVKLNKITNLAGDLALSLGVASVRIAPIPDKISTVGVEVPNKVVSTVYLREIIESANFQNASSKLSFAVGKDIGGNCIVGNISKLPHMLIAGTTGSGKSVCMNSLILSLLYKATPEEVRLIMIDPKMVELGIYNGIPHLYVPVVTDPKKAAGSLQWAVVEMMKRYRLFSEVGVRDLKGYNAYKTRIGEETMPSVVIVIDELADLMMTAAKDVEASICRVAQMGRAAGMHLIIATQRPSADVITGLMKANIPSRIAFAVSSALESRIILDNPGAEKLIGMGDMLYAPLGCGKPLRVQGAFVSDEEREDVINFIKRESSANYDESILREIEKAAKEKDKDKGDDADDDDDFGDGDASYSADTPFGNCDDLLAQAVDVVLDAKVCSVSMLQRRLKVGYSRAGRIVDEMEELGIVGPFEGSKPRPLLITREQWQEMSLSGRTPMERLIESQKDDFSAGGPVQ